jgi:hypothetical protein
VAVAPPGLAQPAAQAARGGQGSAGEMTRENQAHQLGSPLGVFLAQGVDLLEQRVGGAGARGGPVVGRRGNLAAVVPSLAEQVVDGAQGEVKALGQGGGDRPALMGPEQGLADRGRNSAWHGRQLPKKTQETKRTPKC